MAAVAGLGLVAGCGSKNATEVSGKYDEAFRSAPAEVKANWEASKAAMKTNGYVPATIALMNLQSVTTLSPDQRKAVDDTVTAVSDQMYEAANNGDAAAQRAIDELRSASGR